MKLEVLISAMHQTDLSLFKKANIKSDTIIINQCEQNGFSEECIDGCKVRMFSTTERGLSNSRNMALTNSDADICLICDDDEYLYDGYESVILDAFSEYPQADFIFFNIDSTNKKKRYKKIVDYGEKVKSGKAPRFKYYGSLRIAFRRKALIEKGIRFNNCFGAGSGKISAGEESVLQADARRAGLKMYVYPVSIGSVSQQQSTWFEGLNEKYFYDLGACLSQMEPMLSGVLKYYYLLNIKGGELNFTTKLKYLKYGIKWFRKEGYSYQEFIDFVKFGDNIDVH